MNRTIQTQVMKCLTAAIVAIVALPVSAAEIVLKPLAAPQSTVVRLGDVAEIKAADSQDAERLAALPLMPAPMAGKKRYLRQREVQDLLAALGEDVGQLNFGGEASVEIAPAAESLSNFRAAWTNTTPVVPEKVKAIITDRETDTIHEQLMPLFTDYLVRSSGRDANWRVTFDLKPSQVTSLAKATSEFTCMGGSQPWTGKQKFVVTFSTADGLGRVPVTTEVCGTQQVVVAVQPIERGRIVTAADVEVQELDDVPQGSGKHGPIESVESLVGMEASRSIQAGDVVMGDDVKPQILVKRGEEIAVYARGGGIQVRTLARAKQDGAKGQLITVESLEGKEPFDAVVVATREAVVFAGTAAPARETVAERPPFRKLRQ